MAQGHGPGGNRWGAVYGGNCYARIVYNAVDDELGHVRINGNPIACNLSKSPRELLTARKLGFGRMDSDLMNLHS